ncbi:MAG: HAD family phosphatase [Rikenellaceae bacterium]|nr:HAD family phosphatase [Rikenellaceae bacterium]
MRYAMSNIKNVVFDFGGVLVDWNPHHLYDKYFGSSEKATWFLENICRYSWNLQMDKGKLFSEGVAELQAIYPEWSEAIGIYHTRWIEMMGGEVEGTPDLLRRLKAAGYRVFGLSNWSMETFPLVRDEFPIFKELEGKVISGEELMVKPEPEIYHCLFERYSLVPEESVFIDDNADNVAGAKAVGMKAVQFVGAQALERTLSEEYGLKF